MGGFDKAFKWIGYGVLLLGVVGTLFAGYMRVVNIETEIADIHVKVQANDELQQAWRAQESSSDLGQYRRDVLDRLHDLEQGIDALEKLGAESLKQREDRFEELEQEHKETRARLSDIRRDIGVLLGQELDGSE